MSHAGADVFLSSSTFCASTTERDVTAIYTSVHTQAQLMPNSTIHGHRLRTCRTTPPTDKLTTILQLNCCTTNSPPTDKNLPHPNILTCRDVGLWHCDVANLLYESCRIVVSLPVGSVVQHVRSRCPCSGVWHLRSRQIVQLGALPVGLYPYTFSQLRV